MATLEELLALLPDNTAGEISAADMRTIVTDLYVPDTDWRELDLDLGGGNSVDLGIRRIGDQVFCAIRSTTIAGEPGVLQFYSPTDWGAGFMPRYHATGSLMEWNDPTIVKPVAAFDTYGFIYNVEDGQDLRGSISWFTNDTWPATLPGTAA